MSASAEDDLHRRLSLDLEEASRLAAGGDIHRAIGMLVAANLRRSDPLIEERLVALRHDAMTVRAAKVSPAAREWRPEVPDLFDAPGVPEVPVDDLAVDVLRAALLHRGGLIVRGLLDAATSAHLREDVDRAFAAAQAWSAGAPVAETTPWFVPFHPNEGNSFGQLERSFTRQYGGVLSVESPRSLFDVIQALRDAGVGELLEQYFGEWPAISAKKSTLRRATPGSSTEWHQDGAFLGAGTRTVNVWAALTRCGVDAPGIDILPRSFDDIVATGTDSALFPWSVSPEQAQRVGADTAQRWVFEAGDALLFDQMSLHRTGVGPGMTRDRYAIESWFFAPSTYPREQVPILF